ncbi:hypothetical protein AAY473_040396 [Plecturocebus cupreus]
MIPTRLQACPDAVGGAPPRKLSLLGFPVPKEQWSACGNGNSYTEAVLGLVEISNRLAAKTQPLYGRKVFLEREDKDGLCCKKKPQAEDGRTARETCKGTGDDEQTSCQVSWMLKACLERRKVPRLGFADHSKTVKPEGRVGPSFPYALVETVLQKESSSTD